MLYELDGLMLYIIESAALKILHHVGRHIEDPAYLLYTVLTCRKKLAVLGRQADGLVAHALFYDSDLVSVARAAVGFTPLAADLLGVLQDTWMLQYADGLCAIPEKRTAVLFNGQHSAQAVLHHGNGRKTHQPIEAQTGDMEYLIPAEVNVLVLFARRFIRIGMIDVVDFAVVIAVYLDIFRQKRIQADHIILAIPDDLAVGVPPQEQMGHERFTPGKARHLRVRHQVEQPVQRMVLRHFFPIPIVRIAVQMEGKLSDGFRQQPHTGIDRGDLHRGLLVHLFTAGRGAEGEYGAGVPDVILNVWKGVGGVTGFEQSEKARCLHLLLLQKRQFTAAGGKANPVDRITIFRGQNVVLYQCRNSLQEAPFLRHRHLHWNHLLNHHKSTVWLVIYTASLLMTNGTVQPHDERDNAIYLLRGFLLAGFDVLRGIHLGYHVSRHPSENGVASMIDFSLQQELVQLLHAGAHVLEAHADGYHGETVALKIGDELCGIPAVNTDFKDVILLSQLVDGAPDKVVVHNIAFCDMEHALLLPHIVGDMIPPDTHL